MVTITGDMTQAQIDAALIEDLRARVASRQGGEQVRLDRSQAARILELLDAAAKPGQGQGQGKP